VRVHIWWNSVTNERHFTLEAETVFRPYVASHCRGVTETSHVALPSHTPQTVHVLSKSIFNEGHFTLEAERFSVRILPRITARWPKCQAWHPHIKRYKQGKFGRNWSVVRGTSLVRPEVFMPHLASFCSGMTETSHLALPSQWLQAVRIWSTSFGKEGTLLECPTVISPHLASHYSWMTETSQLILPTDVLQVVCVLSKSVDNEG
jgi:hypothetical protein